MDASNFWHDFLVAFQLSPDWIKVLSLIVALAVALTVVVLMIRSGSGRTPATGDASCTVYTIRRDDRGQPHVVAQAPDNADGATHVYLQSADETGT